MKMTENDNLRVCFFGFYDKNYSRNRILLKGLRLNGIFVIECVSNKKGVAKYLELIRKHNSVKGSYDIIFVAYPGYMASMLARILTSKKIVYDAFFSIYDSVINDRREYAKISLHSMYYWCIDWLACRSADKIILDTNANIEYFIKTFGVTRDKFARVFVGSDDEIVFPGEASHNKIFTVHFHGGFNPMQGVEHIIRAAHLLEDKNIRFRIVGKGQTYAKNIQLAEDLGVNNIDFVDEIVPYESLRRYMDESDVCLGIFSDNLKAGIVIPNKAYEAIAMKKPLITRISSAAGELFIDGVNCLLVKPADARALADKIILLYSDEKLRSGIAKNGYELFLSRLTPRIIGKKLSEQLRILCNV